MPPRTRFLGGKKEYVRAGIKQMAMVDNVVSFSRVQKSDEVAMGHTILILGMHRSGTSAMTRVCNLLGTELGVRLIPPGPFNPKGHWEHGELLRINRRMLSVMGASSGFVWPLPKGHLSAQKAEPLQQMIADVIGEDFADAPLWGVKDPDMSRLVPKWLPVLHCQGVTPRFLIMVRHPYEVADSLSARNSFATRKSLLLWLRYSLESEYATRDCLRSIIIHKELMNDWRATVARIEGDLRLQFPIRPSIAGRDIDQFLDKDLHHFQRGSEYASDSAIGELALTGYRALMSRNGTIRRVVLDQVRHTLEDADTRLAKRRLLSRGTMGDLEKEMLGLYRAEKYKPVLRPAMKVARGLAAFVLLLS